MAKDDERKVCKARRVQPRNKDGWVEYSAATHNQIVDIRAWNLDGSCTNEKRVISFTG